jgi:hypothetical protein
VVSPAKPVELLGDPRPGCFGFGLVSLDTDELSALDIDAKPIPFMGSGRKSRAVYDQARLIVADQDDGLVSSSKGLHSLPRGISGGVTSSGETNNMTNSCNHAQILPGTGD